MMQLRFAASMLLVTGAAASVACRSNPAAPGDLGSAQALTTALTEQGATVVRLEQMPATSHCLSVGALRLSVNGENVYVFEYESADAANMDASTVSPDGSAINSAGRGCFIRWTGPPRFYKKDRLIVLYVGSNQDLIRTLDRVLGPPFAGD
jgi:hypothetical protein